MNELFGAFSQHTIYQRRRDGSLKERELMVPDEATREHHEDMLRLLQGLRIDMPYATGSVRGKELLDNVRPHRQNDHFYMADIADAFASVDVDALLAIVNSPLVPEHARAEISDFIPLWATAPQAPGLPLGAPCSPFLFNLYCLPMDRRIGEYCREQDITYTRYLDDLTFSAKGPIGKKRRRHLTELIAETPGMAINHAKSKVHALANGPVTITGVSLQPDRRLQPSPQLLETARQVFTGAEALGLEGTALTESEIGVLHGWHGVLVQLYEGKAETPTRRQLDAGYRRALGLQALLQML